MKTIATLLSCVTLVAAEPAKRPSADEMKACLEEGVRLLKPGGIVAFGGAFGHDKVADPAQRDPDTIAIRGVVTSLAVDERFLPAMLPMGDGLLVAVRV